MSSKRLPSALRLVSGPVPVVVVYPLEVVHVQKDHGELRVPAPSLLDLLAQLSLEVGAVDEVGPSSIGEIQDDARLQEHGRGEKGIGLTQWLYSGEDEHDLVKEMAA